MLGKRKKPAAKRKKPAARRKKPAQHPSLSIPERATLAEVQAALGVKGPPAVEVEHGVQQIFYHLPELGFWVFFDGEMRVQSLRYDGPFPHAVEGVRIGDGEARVLKVLGEPHRRVMFAHNWGYYLPRFMRVDFDAPGGRVETIFR